MVKKGIWKNAGKLRSRRSGGTGCFVIRRSSPDGAGRSLLACGLLFYLGYAADAFVGIEGCRVALPAFAGVADWSAKLRRLLHAPTGGPIEIAIAQWPSGDESALIKLFLWRSAVVVIWFECDKQVRLNKLFFF